jgi:leader peptidase (prepilin peptidase)/N-methyltransferase
MMLAALLAGLFGLLVGSFLNVCIFRMPRDLSVVSPRSFCPGCEKTIAWFDNIPVLSWLLLNGRCRNCGAAIGWRYPVVELITGAAWFFGAWFWGLIATDLEERILPDEFTIGGTIAGVVMAAFVDMGFGPAAILVPLSTPAWVVSVLNSILAAAVGAGVIWLVGWAYEKLRHREGLGFGDVKMIAMIGAFLGLYGSLLTLMLASVAGGVIGIIFILLTKKDVGTYELPFGTFLGIAAAIVAVAGEWMIRMQPGA